MNKKTALLEIDAEIDKTIKVLRKNVAYFNNFKETDYKTLGKKNSSAIVFAEIITDYFTCLETLFLRISRFFENNLDKKKWHKHLLEKMTLNIKDIRIPVIRENTFKLLNELLSFRHFKRYYFEFEYDWERLSYLIKKYEEVNFLIFEDLRVFSKFINELAQ